MKRLTSGKGVDVVYDSVGRVTWEKSLNSLKPRGMMVTFGNASGPVDPVSPLILNQKGSLYLTRPSLGNYTATREELLWRAMDVFHWLRDGHIKLQIHGTTTRSARRAGRRRIWKAAKQRENCCSLSRTRRLILA